MSRGDSFEQRSLLCARNGDFLACLQGQIEHTSLVPAQAMMDHRALRKHFTQRLGVQLHGVIAIADLYGFSEQL
jgi:hypothetical protein